MTRIVVLGAGVIGLSTAINIKTAIPNAEVKIIADKFDNDTTSYGAGGLFRPTTEHIPGVPKQILNQWVTDSWEWFSQLTLSDLAKETGSQLIQNYFFKRSPLNDGLFGTYDYSFDKMSDREMKAMNVDSRYKYGYRTSGIIVCCHRYIPWLTKRWLNQGGIIECRRIEDINELVGNCDLVVNCSGLGSRKLFNDMEIYPTRGQLIQVKADWIKYCMYTDDNIYIIPNGDIINLGGVKQTGKDNMEVDEADSKRMMERCIELCPALKGCTVVSEWVGLRPSRSSVRVESEILNLRKGKLKVVHNYGHGANGIALSWGTAIHATKMAQDMLYTNHSRL